MIAWIDCSAGIAGDMLLGALLDAGASHERVREAVRAVAPVLDVRVERTQRHQIDCAKVTVVDTTSARAADGLPHDHHPNHAHAHPHRPWREVRRLLDDADLDPRVLALAHAAFERLAYAEGAVHGIDPDDVEFHEVGSLDAIGDVVGCAAALVDLDVDTLTASPVTVGHGTQVLGAHGRIPVPGPAVTQLARAARIPVTGGPVAMEMATPTGVAMLAAWCEEFGAPPAMVPDQAGSGAGTRDPEGVANLVRVLVGSPRLDGARSETACPETVEVRSPGEAACGRDEELLAGTGSGTARTEQAIVLEANVDDLDPRVWPTVLDALLAGGAYDAWLIPILMKKGRPAHTLSVLCSPDDRASLVEAIVRHTTTLGVREHPVRRHSLDRRTDPVDVDGHAVDVKVGLLGDEVVNAQPEFEHCRAAADALGVPVQDVVARALAAWWSAR
ncbi:nickel pincer cofactor biosynthesis protein LarC [Mariniluteicoccus endophyticus]